MDTKKIIGNSLQVWGVSFKEFSSGSKKQNIVFAKKFIAYYLYKKGFTLVKIGDILGIKYCTVLIHNKKTREELQHKNSDFAMKYRKFLELCGEVDLETEAINFLKLDGCNLAAVQIYLTPNDLIKYLVTFAEAQMKKV